MIRGELRFRSPGVALSIHIETRTESRMIMEKTRITYGNSRNDNDGRSRVERRRSAIYSYWRRKIWIFCLFERKNVKPADYIGETPHNDREYYAEEGRDPGRPYVWQIQTYCSTGTDEKPKVLSKYARENYIRRTWHIGIGRNVKINRHAELVIPTKIVRDIQQGWRECRLYQFNRSVSTRVRIRYRQWTRKDA